MRMQTSVTAALVLALCLALASCDGSKGGNSDPLPTTGKADSDGDGIVDGSDNCPAVANFNQADIDLDGRGDACDLLDNRDDDGDDVPNSLDNCPAVANPDQADSNSNNVGDACDVMTDAPISGMNGNDATALYRHFNQYANPSE